jgi:hypothetical protein
MSFFPQTGAGSVAQFPLRRSRQWRSIKNDLESSERILLPDSSAGQIEWHLSMKDLSDPETSAISGLFNSSEGQYGAFLFIDPLANLLGWSESLSRPDWQVGLLTVSAGLSDPQGTTRASSLTNASAGAQWLQQTLGIPGDYVTCFSAWVSSSTTGDVTIARDGLTATAPVGPDWKRLYVSGRGAQGATQATFSLAIGAGQTVRVWGCQVEAQPFPSDYKQTSSALGIYEETYFATDELSIKNTGVGLSSCDVALLSRI